MPQVSIIMPCHNGERYISDAIKSVISQTYQDWELLIIDDNSTDNSVSVIESFTKKDVRIKLFHTEKSTGFPATPRNIGIKQAQGRYISFLDCDDVWLPTKLEKQIPLLNGKNAICYSYYEKIAENGDRTNRILKFPPFTTYKKLLKTCVIGNLTGIYDTQLVGKVYQKEIHQEDYVMWLDILHKSDKAICCEENLALYRLSSNSVTSSKLKIFQWQWNTYRKELKFNFFYSCWLYICYAIHGFLKFLK